MRGRYFGTDGFRGEANGTLTAERAFSVGRVLGWYFTEQKEVRAKIVIGKDTRRSSYTLEAALVAGLTASGADVYLLHVTTTPSVSYAVRTENFDCGVMISASHNPYFDNGIKLFNSQGEKMDDCVLAVIEDYLDGKTGEIPYAKREQIGSSIDYVAGRNRYIGHLIALGMYSFKGFKVGLDCANGSAWHIAKTVFDGLGAKTYAIGVEPNGTNINLACGSTHTENLQRLVKEKGLDIGFAFDGDGDRCLCVDERGNLVNGDQILYACARYMKERGELLKNTVVTTVMSNFGLYKALAEQGITYRQTAVGDRFVYECMADGGYALGGEQSGHILFSKYACTGDGILTALKIMEMMIEQKASIFTLVRDMVPFPQILENVFTQDKAGALENKKIRFAIAEAEKMLNGHGRVLVRASGTEPILRVMAEGDDEALCKECVRAIAEAIENFHPSNKPV